MINAATKRN